MFIKQAFDQFLELEYERVDQKTVKVSLPVKSMYRNSLGVVHGGIISSLADVAMCNTIEPNENNQQKVVTVDLNVSFLKGGKGDLLVAHAQVVKEGRTLTHTECQVFNDQKEMVAKASAVLFNVEGA
ncbi:PaaI family thioesterase [Fictibacillus sp. KIGAM418]|uniref:PaaI family thioesterase n=1 Tax=Fictibacillus marinisediminis TaxID=2878389 RepID=A0A9X2BFP3_9BACL|nr:MULTISPECIES: PaaI family thioesterase [Fictibacillus]MCK6258985.1 PaaI family thioesterase [Fictibacillus marinisediminis]MED2974701.1 PaaI family thioesterase [Fictibacillus sp. B-59209]UZJ79387.1 PaaI family thioesterase [Fictibacillus sp. KU28468]SFD35928.1 acyl-CoA thioesterase [Bacillus sp. OV194]